MSVQNGSHRYRAGRALFEGVGVVRPRVPLATVRLLSGLDPALGEPLKQAYIGHDFNVKSCQLLRRPDMLFIFDRFALLIEVDEHQHKFGYDSLLSCDMRRMSKVMGV